MTDKVIAVWASKGNKWIVDLYADESGYYYTAINGGGALGPISNNTDAIQMMQKWIDLGGYQPDSNKTPMKLIYDCRQHENCGTTP